MFVGYSSRPTNVISAGLGNRYYMLLFYSLNEKKLYLSTDQDYVHKLRTELLKQLL